MLIRLRLRGRYACWTPVGYRAERISAALPSHDAWRGLLRHILGKNGCTYLIHRVLLLSPPKRVPITSNEFKFNNVGMRPVLSSNGQHTQRTTVYMANPDYLLEFRLGLTPQANRAEDTLEKYNAMFVRRAKKGQQDRQPVFGITECPVRYVDLIDDCDLKSLPPTVPWSENLGITFFGADWDKRLNYFHPLEIKSGVLEYPTWSQVRDFDVTKPIGRPPCD